MRLIFQSKDGYSHGSSGKVHGKTLPLSEWAGRWDEFYFRQKYPRTHWIRKYFRKKNK